MSTPFGAQSAWRQLVDLVGRGRVDADSDTIGLLRRLRGSVPVRVRSASARAIAFATPPAALVGVFADDETSVAAPVLRTAQLADHEWIAVLPRLSPVGRSILRHRRDLSPTVERALQSFGSVDFVLQQDNAPVAPAPVEAPPEPAAVIAEVRTTTFVSIATVAHKLPVVAEALRKAEETAPADGTFEIAELVARIDAFQRTRDETPQARPQIQTELFTMEAIEAPSFRFETDADGIIRWIEGAARAPLIGLSLDLGDSPAAHVDGVAAGAFRRRSGFANARLVVEGISDAAGQWRISGTPMFDRATGRFSGYRGTARRPRADESAELSRDRRRGDADALRQLVHELRTPTNAIAGFAEMIETQMLGPVPLAYRSRAESIRQQASALLGAIDDIDMAARIDSRALDLRSGSVVLAPMLVRVIEDLAPLATMRGARVETRLASDTIAIVGDDRAIERLLGRLLATLVAAAGAKERIGVAAQIEERQVVIAFDRPEALADYSADGLMQIDAEAAAEEIGAPLLGTGFALRLARNLAVELGGSLTIGGAALTLRLPAALSEGMGQASTN
ncbi:sensor histidine kinase [Sphingomonas immobilis]|uniref:histidine kinase n=1 Tax=Sphingomonas immobilis TaxID=3063997 RepID=A0ABT8ZZM2_9SPHN|nr:HAMP domain-containing sensor histidine kinase [Sphingomonas sp. CA1-15]MDO7843031.1 HAMP domain-containing sensor histidine kinase [Sphingomonas sp. CA1-15]